MTWSAWETQSAAVCDAYRSSPAAWMWCPEELLSADVLPPPLMTQEMPAAIVKLTAPAMK
ncbi:hypothetical protein [Streptomyces sp. AS02]|uniref:hypothetical protein n=1 Tax=Streptomyces sp. AS02 TaxID=2938946 RepID=UPI002021260C|nr:hypothetical protein [Streptomyces sp. AS02]MCL8011721.1 hypothetical protein [Streptomyces sp. AS02]